MEYLDKRVMAEMKKRYKARKKEYQKELSEQVKRQGGVCPECWERFTIRQVAGMDENVPVLAVMLFDLQEEVRCAVHDKCQGRQSN